MPGPSSRATTRIPARSSRWTTESMISPRPAQVVPYRCNRAAVFASMAAHSTDSFRFKNEYASRRVNITLLFGHPRGG